METKTGEIIFCVIYSMSDPDLTGLKKKMSDIEYCAATQTEGASVRDAKNWELIELDQITTPLVLGSVPFFYIFKQSFKFLDYLQ